MLKLSRCTGKSSKNAINIHGEHLFISSLINFHLLHLSFTPFTCCWPIHSMHRNFFYHLTLWFRLIRKHFADGICYGFCNSILESVMFVAQFQSHCILCAVVIILALFANIFIFWLRISKMIWNAIELRIISLFHGKCDRKFNETFIKASPFISKHLSK